MKNALKSLGILFLAWATLLGPTQAVQAAEAAGSDDIGQVVDVSTSVGGNVKDCAESLQEFLSETKDEQALEMVVGALKKAGLKGGWAKQIGGLKKFAGLAGKLLDMIKVGDTVRRLSDVWNDREAFSSVFADQMTEYAADFVSTVVSGLIKSGGTALIAGGTLVAPGAGTIVATGVVWLVSWAGGKAAGWVFEKIADTDVLRGGMENLGGAIWDYFHNGSGQEEADPFDSEPSSTGGQKTGGDSSNGYRGLRQLRLVD